MDGVEWMEWSGWSGVDNVSVTSHKRRLCGFPVPAIVCVPLAFCFKFCLVNLDSLQSYKTKYEMRNGKAVFEG